jgi:hypothetical protein
MRLEFSTALADMRVDLSEMRADNQREFADVRSELSTALADVRSESQREFADVRLELASQRSELGSVRTEIMARLDRLQNRFDTVRDDLTVNYQANEHTERLARNALEETRSLSEVVSSMHRQIRRISAKVFGSDDETP